MLDVERKKIIEEMENLKSNAINSITEKKQSKW